MSNIFTAGNKGRRIRAGVLALLGCVLTWRTPTAAHAQVSHIDTTSALEAGTDPTVIPGDDFFAYANGGWLKTAQIPPGRERWTTRNEIDTLTRRQVETLIDQGAAQPPGSVARKVADFRAAYLNEAAIEAHGLAPLQPRLDSIDRMRDKAALARLLGRWVRADVDPLNCGIYQSSHVIGLSVERGLHGEKTNLALLLQGGLGLPDRQQYLSTGPAMQALRSSYQRYIGQMLELARFDHAELRARAVMVLETALAGTQATREASANDQNVDHHWTRADFSRRAPGMDWPAFFDAAGLRAQDDFVAWQPSAITGLAALVASQPLAAWQDYLRFHLIHTNADVLPRGFAELAMQLRTAEDSSVPSRPREQRALDAIQSAMSDALGRLYAERYFPAAQKARVQAIATDVIAALSRRVEAASWMSPGARAIALAKLKSLYFGVGYPETWQDYSDLVVDPADPAGNLRRVEDHNYRLALARIGQPPSHTQWWIAPQTVGAVLLFQQNAYNFPAALLQVPKYDSTASNAANYGAIGAIIGHEASHFIDMLGMDYDTGGELHRWWTPEDIARFEALAAELVSQYDSYHPLPGLVLNGQQTRGENVADLAGLTAAFDAYRSALGPRASDAAYLRRLDREFFLGFARSWRSRTSEAGLRTQVATDTHAPDNYRIATVRNLDAWYAAFDVKPGQQLYLDPGARVLLASGYSLDGQASDILKRGCRAFIQKPFGLTELSEKLQVTLAAGT